MRKFVVVAVSLLAIAAATDRVFAQQGGPAQPGSPGPAMPLASSSSSFDQALAVAIINAMRNRSAKASDDASLAEANAALLQEQSVNLSHQLAEAQAMLKAEQDKTAKLTNDLDDLKKAADASQAPPAASAKPSTPAVAPSKSFTEPE